MKCLSSVFLVFLVVCIGCTPVPSSTPVVQPTTALDINATVSAAVELTEEVKTAVQSTISASVSSTIAAIPSPTPVDTVSMTEEQLAEIVNDAAQAAAEATQQAAEVTSQAASDGSLTADEVEATSVYVAFSAEEIAQAMALAEEYLALYAGLGEETITLLTEVEEDLSQMAASTEAMEATLTEIEQALDLGVALAEDTVAELQSQAETAQQKADETKSKIDGWAEQVKSEIEERSALVEQFQPDDVAGDRRGAIDQLKNYIDTLQVSFQDGKFSRAEIDSILQLGKNASASLRGQGGSEFNELADRVDGLTRQVARGEIPQVKTGMSNLEQQMPGR